MANKKVNIDITTTANTSGSDKTVKSIEQIERAKAKQDAAAEASAAREAARQARAEAAAERAAGVALRREERAAKQVEIASQRKEAAARREEAAIKRVQAADDAAAAAAAKNAARVEEVSGQKAGRGKGIQIQQAGYQVADFATQVGAGTSAVQAMGQQLPQLLGAFGPWGAVIGAAAAVLIPLGRALADVAAQSEKTKESLDRAKDFIGKFAEASKKAGEQDVQSLTDKLKQQTTTLENLQKAEANSVTSKENVAKAHGEIAQSYLDAEEATLKYLTQTGKIVDAENRLIEIEKERTKIATEAKVAAEAARLASAQAEYNNAIARKKDVERQIAELEKRADEAARSMSGPTNQLNLSVKSDKFTGLKEPSLKTQTLQAELDAIATQLSAYYESIKTLEGQFPALGESIAQAGYQIDATKVEVEANIEKIKTQADLTETTATLTRETGKQVEEVGKIKEVVGGLEAVTPLQEEIKARLTAAVSDSNINTAEQRQIAGDLQTLTASLTAAQSGNRQGIQELISINNQLVTFQAQTNAEIRQLAQKVKTLQFLQNIK
jgi:DNA repair exonuclease SbcCD ATPase subunit